MIPSWLASIDSPLGSLSASFVTDIYRPLLVSGRSERHYLWVSRVAVVLGYADLAEWFGERSLAVCEEHDLDPFVRGFAHEAIARAAAEVDDVETFTEHLELAKALLAEIEDPEDRDTLAADLIEMSEP